EGRIVPQEADGRVWFEHALSDPVRPERTVVERRSERDRVGGGAAEAPSLAPAFQPPAGLRAIEDDLAGDPVGTDAADGERRPAIAAPAGDRGFPDVQLGRVVGAEADRVRAARPA